MLQLTPYPPLRGVTDPSLGKVLADIESHMPAGHAYRHPDKITWGHETSHGIAANVRMQHGRQGQNGFYLLENRAVIIDEPATTIREVAKVVPESLRGSCYRLYLVDQTQHWNNRPLYLFDEWVAYGHGSEVRLDLGISDRGETVYKMLEFSAYALCVAMVARTTDPQFIGFLRWHLARARTLYYLSENLGANPQADDYLRTLRMSDDAAELRRFTKEYLGAAWVQSVLEF